MGGLFSKPKAPPTPAPTIIYRDRVRSETAKVDTKLDAAKKSKAGTGRASLSTTEAGLKPTTAEKDAKRKRTKFRVDTADVHCSVAKRQVLKQD